MHLERFQSSRVRFHGRDTRTSCRMLLHARSSKKKQLSIGNYTYLVEYVFKKMHKFHRFQVS